MSRTATVRERVRFGAVQCDAVDYHSALTRVEMLLRSGTPHLVLTPNIAQVFQASRMPIVAEAYRHVSLATPDGWPMAVGLRLLGARPKGRVTGSDLTPMLCNGSYRVAIIGGKADSARRAADRLAMLNPELDVAAVELVPREELSHPVMRRQLLDRLTRANADLYFVGVGVPKQEQLALDLLRHLDRGVVLCVGASIEFIAGTTTRSPRWVQRLQFEWLYRILLEPRRMAGRYAKAAPFFVWTLGVELVRQLLWRRWVSGTTS